MGTVRFENVTRIYPGSTEPAVKSLNLDIPDGEFLVLVGPSGCGKTTSLRMLAGLEDVNEGHIYIGDREVTNIQPKDRDIAMVFQNYALYPHMTVRENMGFALKIAKVPRDQINARVEQAAHTLGLTPYLDRKPKALSGGQRQRVAMGRAIVRQPQVFLMDEPLSNLDAKLRVQTRTQIASLQRELGITTLYVTHDQTEALTMGDRIAVIKEGVLQQVGTPRELYDYPANAFVAGFIGSPAMNLGRFMVEGEDAVLGTARIPLTAATRAALNGSREILVGFRPEGLDVAGDEATATIPLSIDLVEELGSDAFVYGHLASGEHMTIVDDDDADHEPSDKFGQIVVRVPPHTAPPKGSIMHVRVRDGQLHVFDSKTHQRLPQ